MFVITGFLLDEGEGVEIVFGWATINSFPEGNPYFAQGHKYKVDLLALVNPRGFAVTYVELDFVDFVSFD